MEDNQIYSIQLLENEGITPSTRGEGYDKSYCPTKQEFIDSGFSKSGYNISIDGIIAINQLIPKTALTETASVIKFELNPISLYPCSDWCIEDGGEQVTPSATTYGAIVFSGVSSVVMSLINGAAASIKLCTDKNNIYGTLVQDFQWSFYSADTFTVDREEWIYGYVNTVLPENKTNENKKYYLVLDYQYETPGDQSIFEIIQSKYWEPPYWYVSTGLNFPSAVPKSGGRYAVTIKDPYNVGWIIDKNTEYKIDKQTGKGNITFNVEIPKATSVGAQTGAIYGFRPIVAIGDEIYGGNGAPDGYVNIRDVPATEDCLGNSSDCINVWQYGLDKPSLSEFPSTMTLPDTKKWESAPNGSMDYLVGSSVTNSDYVEYMIQLPNWCICKGMDISFHSGGTNCYSGTSSYVNFSLQINPNSYFDKSHYDGDMKLYYKQDNRYYLADTKKIVKCARPSMETALALNNGNIVYNPGLEVIYVKDEDSCGYELTISGDSNYSAWTFTVNDAQSNTTYYGNKEFGVSIPQNLTDNDIEGYINLHSSYNSKPILESIPFKQECYKLKVYFTGQNFKDGYAEERQKYITLLGTDGKYIPLTSDFNPLNVSEGITIRNYQYEILNSQLNREAKYYIFAGTQYATGNDSIAFVLLAENVPVIRFYLITKVFKLYKDNPITVNVDTAS